ncbi:MAG: plasmid mobilization relaxosome protein MobC [Oscillospiraceae bacterium]|nr:plasmid mobilization relaxosome protein MobC [Oscillospiraceae bacterium]
METTKRSRNLNVSFRVSEQERDLIEKKMELAGIRSLRAYLLKMAVDGYVVQLDLSEVRHMVTLLRTATNNMNQIARRTHETGNLYDADIRDLQEHYDKLWEQAGGILKKLSEL